MINCSIRHLNNLNLKLLMKKAAGYFALVIFAGIAILLLSSYSKWFYPELQPNPAKKEEQDLQDVAHHEQISLQETLSADAAGTNQIQVSDNLPDENMHIIVVPYFETSNSDWKVLYDEADKNPGVIKYAIINPCSGPCGKSLSAEWQQIISELRKRDIKTLGYIFDTLQSIENIDHYMKAPVPTDGIFFDNEGSTYTIDKFRQYAKYVHNLGGIVYINPGFNYPYIMEYIEGDLVDVTNIYEFESSKSHHMEIDKNIHPSKLSAILGNVFSVSEMIQMVHETAETGIGTVFVYSDSYYGLPRFFPELVREAAVTRVQSNLLEIP